MTTEYAKRNSSNGNNSSTKYRIILPQSLLHYIQRGLYRIYSGRKKKLLNFEHMLYYYDIYCHVVRSRIALRRWLAQRQFAIWVCFGRSFYSNASLLHVILFVLPLKIHSLRMLFHEHFVLDRERVLFLFKGASKDAFTFKICSYFICGKCFDFSRFSPSAINVMRSQTTKVNHPQNDAQIFKHLIMYVTCNVISYHLHCQP